MACVVLRRRCARARRASSRASARKAASVSADGRDVDRVLAARKVALDRARVRRDRSAARGARRPARPSSPARGRVGPALDRLPAVQRNEAREPRGQRVGVGEEVRVLVLQQRDAQRLRQLDADAARRARIAASSASGSCTVPIFRLSDSTKTGRAGSKRSSADSELRCRTTSATAAGRRAGRPAASRDGRRDALRGRAPARRRAASAAISRLLPEPVSPQTTT